MPDENFSKTLKKLRIMAGLSQGDVCRIFNIKQSRISGWETGNSAPSAEMFLKLCKLYGVKDVLATFGYRSLEERNKEPEQKNHELELVNKIKSLDPDMTSLLIKLIDELYTSQQLKEALNRVIVKPEIKQDDNYLIAAHDDKEKLTDEEQKARDENIQKLLEMQD